MAHERPISSVPRTAVAVLLFAACMQVAIRNPAGPSASRSSDLPYPPSAMTARAAGFGDPLPVAKLLMLHLQSFDFGAENRAAYQTFDYRVLQSWLALILSLDPQGQYPLMAASRIYADVPDPAKQREMLEFVYRQFLEDPDRRWPWLAHAAAIAKHRLKDLPLARRYAAAIQEHATSPAVPTWARQMEAFILEDMDELETARIMIGGFLEKGLIKDESEARFLEGRLRELEQRTDRGK